MPDTIPGAAKGAVRKEIVFKWQAASEGGKNSIKDGTRIFGFYTRRLHLALG